MESSIIRIVIPPSIGVEPHNLRSYLDNDDADMKSKCFWALQIAEALEFIHNSGIIHGDLTRRHVLLDEHLRVKIADFAASSLDGSELLLAVTPSPRYPGPILSATGDVFAG